MPKTQPPRAGRSGIPDGTPDLYVTFRNADQSSDPRVLVPGTGCRLIPYNIPDKASFVFSDAHRDGYNYGFETIPYRSFSGFWGANPRELETRMIQVRLKRADRIFVVDEHPFLNARKNPGPKPDITTIFAAIAKTIVPLAAYRRDYIRPVYLIGRPLLGDEAQCFEPGFRVRLRQEEAVRQAQSAPARLKLLEELFGKNQTGDPPDPKSPPHLRLV